MENRKALVIYHAGCTDGFASAWCFWDCFESVDFHPGIYNEPPPDVTGRDVFLVDFSYKRAVVEAMLKIAKNVTLIDHHASAIKDLQGLSGLNTYTDINHSGAVLAWNYLHQFSKKPAPLLIQHIEDRDLWKFDMPNTREIHAWLSSHPQDFNLWDAFMTFGEVKLGIMAQEGAVIMRKFDKELNEILPAVTRRMSIAGHNVPVANVPPSMASEAGNLLCANELFAACYHDTAEGRVFGLRSKKPHGTDVQEIATSLGGGGHKHAAGFVVPRTHELAKL